MREIPDDRLGFTGLCTPNLITIAVYDLAALWQRDREAALAIADASRQAAQPKKGDVT